jgi:hypothetical protein
MWVIAGVLLGLVVLASLVGFHAGPHAHAAAGVFGALAAGWLVLMVVEGRSLPVLLALLSAGGACPGRRGSGVRLEVWGEETGRELGDGPDPQLGASQQTPTNLDSERHPS